MGEDSSLSQIGQQPTPTPAASPTEVKKNPEKTITQPSSSSASNSFISAICFPSNGSNISSVGPKEIEALDYALTAMGISNPDERCSIMKFILNNLNDPSDLFSQLREFKTSDELNALRAFAFMINELAPGLISETLSGAIDEKKIETFYAQLKAALGFFKDSPSQKTEDYPQEIWKFILSEYTKQHKEETRMEEQSEILHSTRYVLPDLGDEKKPKPVYFAKIYPIETPTYAFAGYEPILNPSEYVYTQTDDKKYVLADTAEDIFYRATILPLAEKYFPLEKRKLIDAPLLNNAFIAYGNDYWLEEFEPLLKDAEAYLANLDFFNEKQTELKNLLDWEFYFDGKIKQYLLTITDPSSISGKEPIQLYARKLYNASTDQEDNKLADTFILKTKTIYDSLFAEEINKKEKKNFEERLEEARKGIDTNSPDFMATSLKMAMQIFKEEIKPVLPYEANIQKLSKDLEKKSVSFNRNWNADNQIIDMSELKKASGIKGKLKAISGITTEIFNIYVKAEDDQKALFGQRVYEEKIGIGRLLAELKEEYERNKKLLKNGLLVYEVSSAENGKIALSERMRLKINETEQDLFLLKINYSGDQYLNGIYDLLGGEKKFIDFVKQKGGRISGEDVLQLKARQSNNRCYQLFSYFDANKDKADPPPPPVNLLSHELQTLAKEYLTFRAALDAVGLANITVAEAWQALEKTFGISAKEDNLSSIIFTYQSGGSLYEPVGNQFGFMGTKKSGEAFVFNDGKPSLETEKKDEIYWATLSLNVIRGLLLYSSSLDPSHSTVQIDEPIGSNDSKAANEFLNRISQESSTFGESPFANVSFNIISRTISFLKGKNVPQEHWGFMIDLAVGIVAESLEKLLTQVKRGEKLEGLVERNVGIILEDVAKKFQKKLDELKEEVEDLSDEDLTPEGREIKKHLDFLNKGSNSQLIQGLILEAFFPAVIDTFKFDSSLTKELKGAKSEEIKAIANQIPVLVQVYTQKPDNLGKFSDSLKKNNLVINPDFVLQFLQNASNGTQVNGNTVTAGKQQMKIFSPATETRNINKESGSVLNTLANFAMDSVVPSRGRNMKFDPEKDFHELVVTPGWENFIFKLYLATNKYGGWGFIEEKEGELFVSDVRITGNDLRAFAHLKSRHSETVLAEANPHEIELLQRVASYVDSGKVVITDIFKNVLDDKSVIAQETNQALQLIRIFYNQTIRRTTWTAYSQLDQKEQANSALEIETGMVGELAEFGWSSAKQIFHLAPYPDIVAQDTDVDVQILALKETFYAEEIKVFAQLDPERQRYLSTAMIDTDFIEQFVKRYPAFLQSSYLNKIMGMEGERFTEKDYAEFLLQIAKDIKEGRLAPISTLHVNRNDIEKDLILAKLILKGAIERLMNAEDEASMESRASASWADFKNMGANLLLKQGAFPYAKAIKGFLILNGAINYQNYILSSNNGRDVYEKVSLQDNVIDNLVLSGVVLHFKNFLDNLEKAPAFKEELLSELGKNGITFIKLQKYCKTIEEYAAKPNFTFSLSGPRYGSFDSFQYDDLDVALRIFAGIIMPNIQSLSVGSEKPFNVSLALLQRFGKDSLDKELVLGEPKMPSSDVQITSVPVPQSLRDEYERINFGYEEQAGSTAGKIANFKFLMHPRIMAEMQWGFFLQLLDGLVGLSREDPLAAQELLKTLKDWIFVRISFLAYHFNIGAWLLPSVELMARGEWDLVIPELMAVLPFIKGFLGRYWQWGAGGVRSTVDRVRRWRRGTEFIGVGEGNRSFNLRGESRSVFYERSAGNILGQVLKTGRRGAAIFYEGSLNPLYDLYRVSDAIDRQFIDDSARRSSTGIRKLGENYINFAKSSLRTRFYRGSPVFDLSRVNPNLALSCRAMIESALINPGAEFQLVFGETNPVEPQRPLQRPTLFTSADVLGILTGDRVSLTNALKGKGLTTHEANSLIQHLQAAYQQYLVNNDPTLQNHESTLRAALRLAQEEKIRIKDQWKTILNGERPEVVTLEFESAARNEEAPPRQSFRVQGINLRGLSIDMWGYLRAHVSPYTWDLAFGQGPRSRALAQRSAYYLTRTADVELALANGETRIIPLRDYLVLQEMIPHPTAETQPPVTQQIVNDYMEIEREIELRMTRENTYEYGDYKRIRKTVMEEIMRSGHSEQVNNYQNLHKRIYHYHQNVHDPRCGSAHRFLMERLVGRYTLYRRSGFISKAMMINPTGNDPRFAHESERVKENQQYRRAAMQEFYQRQNIFPLEEVLGSSSTPPPPQLPETMPINLTEVRPGEFGMPEGGRSEISFDLAGAFERARVTITGGLDHTFNGSSVSLQSQFFTRVQEAGIRQITFEGEIRFGNGGEDALRRIIDDIQTNGNGCRNLRIFLNERGEICSEYLRSIRDTRGSFSSRKTKEVMGKNGEPSSLQPKKAQTPTTKEAERRAAERWAETVDATLKNLEAKKEALLRNVDELQSNGKITKQKAETLKAQIETNHKYLQDLIKNSQDIIKYPEFKEVMSKFERLIELYGEKAKLEEISTKNKEKQEVKEATERKLSEIEKKIKSFEKGLEQNKSFFKKFGEQHQMLLLIIAMELWMNRDNIISGKTAFDVGAAMSMYGAFVLAQKKLEGIGLKPGAAGIAAGALIPAIIVAYHEREALFSGDSDRMLASFYTVGATAVSGGVSMGAMMLATRALSYFLPPQLKIVALGGGLLVAGPTFIYSDYILNEELAKLLGLEDEKLKNQLNQSLKDLGIDEIRISDGLKDSEDLYFQKYEVFDKEGRRSETSSAVNSQLFISLLGTKELPLIEGLEAFEGKSVKDYIKSFGTVIFKVNGYYTLTPETILKVLKTLKEFKDRNPNLNTFEVRIGVESSDYGPAKDYYKKEELVAKNMEVSIVVSGYRASRAQSLPLASLGTALKAGELTQILKAEAIQTKVASLIGDEVEVAKREGMNLMQVALFGEKIPFSNLDQYPNLKNELTIVLVQPGYLQPSDFEKIMSGKLKEAEANSIIAKGYKMFLEHYTNLNPRKTNVIGEKGAQALCAAYYGVSRSEMVKSFIGIGPESEIVLASTKGKETSGSIFSKTSMTSSIEALNAIQKKYQTRVDNWRHQNKTIFHGEYLYPMADLSDPKFSISSDRPDEFFDKVIWVEEVSWVQVALVQLGYLNESKISGRFDDATHEALLKFAKSKGVKPLYSGECVDLNILGLLLNELSKISA